MSTEIRQVTIQIASCSKQNAYGLVETGYYTVEDGFVQMCIPLADLAKFSHDVSFIVRQP
jgi:hypothetical protein